MRIVMFASLPRALRCTAINGGDGLPLACAPPPSCIRGPSIRRAPVVPRQTAFWGPCSASPCGGAPRAPRAALVPHAPARPRPHTRRCLPPHPPPAHGASLQAARVIYMRRVTRAPPGHHKFPSLSICASRWRFILINPKLQGVRGSCELSSVWGTRSPRRRRARLANPRGQCGTSSSSCNRTTGAGRGIEYTGLGYDRSTEPAVHSARPC